MTPVILRDIKWLAKYLNVGEMRLRNLMRDCPVNGHDSGNPYSGMYTADLRLLYALVRILEPERALEIGTHHGSSANAIAAAMLDNGKGHLITVDISVQAGQHIEADYSPYVSFVNADGNTYIENLQDFDFIHEDGAHSPHSIHTLYSHIWRLLNKGGVILSHDVLLGVREHIEYGIRAAGLDFPPVEVLKVHGSPCGYTVYRRP